MLNLPTPRPRAVLLLPFCLALLSLFLALPVFAAQVNPAPVDPAIDVLALIKLVRGHEWLPLAIFGVAIARTLLSERSTYLKTIPSTWLPTVSAVLGGAFTALIAIQHGAPVGVTLVGALLMFVASGALDGLLVAMFGDPSKAPWWARLVVGIADKVVGGGSGSASATKPAAPPAPKTTLPPAAPRLAIATMAALCLLLTGCPNGTVPPNVAPVVNGALVLTECAWTTYTTDTGKVPPDPWQQVAMDLAMNCGMDVADIVQAFGKSHPVTVAAQANAVAVHNAAMTAKAGK